MSNDLKLYLQILGNASSLKNELKGSKNAVKSFTNDAKNDFASLRNTLAGIGISISAISLLAASAKLDKSLIQIGQTAGASKNEIAKLRTELFDMSKVTGQNVDSLKEGFNSLIQSGLNMTEAKATLDGINTAMAVTGADAQTLAAGLTVAAQAFQFDLSKPGQALELLDHMTQAGRLGNAELQNLSDIFARVGVNAASAGMSFDKTLAFIETLSMVERQPERLATLADDTIKLFTNINYMKSAQKVTGIKFFDKSGSRRDAMSILADIKKEYDSLKTDAEKNNFIGKAFGKADQGLIKGLRTLLNSDMIAGSGQFYRTIARAGGLLKHDLPDAVDNAADRVSKLKNALKEAADEFAQPLNNTTKNIIGFLMDSRDKGGLNLSGKEMAIGAATAAGGSYVAAKLGKWLWEGLKKNPGKIPGGKLIDNLTGTATGIAEGLALKQIGVTPVFVTNWPAGGIGSGINIPSIGPSNVPGKGITLPDILTKNSPIKDLGMKALIGGFGALNASSLSAAFAAAPVMSSLLVAGAGAAGYGFGTLINKFPELWGGEDVSTRIADALYDAMHRDDQKKPELNNNINITIDKTGKPTVVETKGGNPAKVNVFNRGKFLPGTGGM